MPIPPLWVHRELLIALQWMRGSECNLVCGEDEELVNAIPDRGEGMDVQCSDSCRERERGGGAVV